MIAPLYRAAMEVSLERAGVERPRVRANGRVFERPYVERDEDGSLLSVEPKQRPMTDGALTDGAFVVQAVIEADAMLTALTGQAMTCGKEILDALSIGSGEVEVLKDRRSEVGHDFTPDDLRDVLTKARRMIVGVGK